MAEAGKKPFRASAIIATVLYLADGFFLFQGFFALVFFVVVLLYFLPATLWALRADRRVARLRATKGCIYLLAAVSILATIGLQNSMADRKAVKLGDACLAYRAKYHRYPRNLEALVPEFTSSVPVPRYDIFGVDRFTYFSHEDDQEPMLYYQVIPPFSRRFYHMETRSWGYMD
jgi:hypothetical protein